MNDLTTKSFTSCVDLKTTFMKDAAEAGPDLELGRAQLDYNLTIFLEEAEQVKMELNSIKENPNPIGIRKRRLRGQKLSSETAASGRTLGDLTVAAAARERSRRPGYFPGLMTYSFLGSSESTGGVNALLESLLFLKRSLDFQRQQMIALVRGENNVETERDDGMMQLIKDEFGD